MHRGQETIPFQTHQTANLHETLQSSDRPYLHPTSHLHHSTHGHEEVCADSGEQQLCRHSGVCAHRPEPHVRQEVQTVDRQQLLSWVSGVCTQTHQQLLRPGNESQVRASSGQRVLCRHSRVCAASREQRVREEVRAEEGEPVVQGHTRVSAATREQRVQTCVCAECAQQLLQRHTAVHEEREQQLLRRGEGVCADSRERRLCGHEVVHPHGSQPRLREACGMHSEPREQLLPRPAELRAAQGERVLRCEGGEVLSADCSEQVLCGNSGVPATCEQQLLPTTREVHTVVHEQLLQRETGVPADLFERILRPTPAEGVCA